MAPELSPKTRRNLKRRPAQSEADTCTQIRTAIQELHRIGFHPNGLCGYLTLTSSHHLALRYYFSILIENYTNPGQAYVIVVHKSDTGNWPIKFLSPPSWGGMGRFIVLSHAQESCMKLAISSGQFTIVRQRAARRYSPHRETNVRNTTFYRQISRIFRQYLWDSFASSQWPKDEKEMPALEQKLRVWVSTYNNAIRTITVDKVSGATVNNDCAP